MKPSKQLLETVLTFDAVRKLGSGLPDVVVGKAYGSPALKLNGKLLACIPTNKSAEANSVVVRIDPEQRAELLRQDPNIYYITDHYAPHPTVLVRLSNIRLAELKTLLCDAHKFVLSEQKRPVRLTGSMLSSRSSKARGGKGNPRPA